ncbi:MAG: DUF4105 domain-containing protein [Nitrospirota bacterium]
MRRERKTLKVLTLPLFWAVLIGVVGWSALAIYYSNLPPIVGKVCSILFALAAVVVIMRVRPWRRAAAMLLAGFGIVLAGWMAIPPSNDRMWRPDVAVLPYATMDGDLVTVHNIRNFDYRSETDFTSSYYDKTFDLRQLDAVDLFAVYWMGPHIAHTFLSFGFGGKDYLAVSIETRKEQGEGYSTIKGFFRQYELFYVVADERDVVRVRTNYRKPAEDVYLYRIRGSAKNGRSLFLEYMQRINGLKERPEFYNTVTANCTTAIWLNAQVVHNPLPFSWKLLLSGHTPEYLYEQGLLDQSLPFAELQKRSWINARARAADGADDFSARIRADADAAWDLD